LKFNTEVSVCVRNAYIATNNDSSSNNNNNNNNTLRHGSVRVVGHWRRRCLDRHMYAYIYIYIYYYHVYIRWAVVFIFQNVCDLLFLFFQRGARLLALHPGEQLKPKTFYTVLPNIWPHPRGPGDFVYLFFILIYIYV